MKVIEQSQNKIVLGSRISLWWALLIGTIFPLGGIFFCLFGLALQKLGYPFGFGVMFLGMGGILAIGSFFVAVTLAETTVYIFDKSRYCILLEKRTLGKKSKKQLMIECPSHLIFEVEIETVSGDEGVGYYPNLILVSNYWRIRLKSNGDYQSAVKFATMIATFLDIPCFSGQLKAPAPTFYKLLERLEPWRFSWQYLEDEVERLQQLLRQKPYDAEAHQNLGIALYYLNPWLNRRQMIVHLQQAEELLEAQQDSECAAITKVIKTLVSWNY